MPTRLGDVIEDHCSRCTRLTDHSVVAMMNDDVVKVRCRTCNHEHAYKHGRGSRKQPLDKKSAFDQVLAGILADQVGEDPATAPPTRQRARAASDGVRDDGAKRSKRRSATK